MKLFLDEDARSRMTTLTISVLKLSRRSFKDECDEAVHLWKNMIDTATRKTPANHSLCTFVRIDINFDY